MLPLFFSHFVVKVHTTYVIQCNVGWAPWNLSCLEFKFDDARLSYWHKNKIGKIEKKNCCFLTLLIFCPVGLLSFVDMLGLWPLKYCGVRKFSTLVCVSFCLTSPTPKRLKRVLTPLTALTKGLNKCTWLKGADLELLINHNRTPSCTQEDIYSSSNCPAQ